jgi:hypothetical protein
MPLYMKVPDHECRRFAFDRATPCGCWPEEGAEVRPLPEATGRPNQRQRPRLAA